MSNAPNIQDWLGFLARWIHLITAISWIGSSFYFIWLDSHLEESTTGAKDVEGELWMVHSGGFYQVLRKRIGPGTMPKTLHWFKYEALFTWVSGIFLLGLIYYLSGGVYLIDPQVALISPAVGIAISVGLLCASWLIYDALWLTLGKSKPELTTAICLALVTVLSYGLCHVFSGRAAFIHVGAIFGTIMVANVWMRILPAQQKMIDATTEGRTPDFALSGYAKRRSVHNSYMTFPVLFMMLSNHYAMVYAHPLNWLILLLLVVFGTMVRHSLISKHSSKRWILAPAALALVVMIAVSGYTSMSPLPGGHVAFSEVQGVIQKRCLQCHSSHPTDDVFKAPPNGVIFESQEKILALVDRIKLRVVVTKTMPFTNKTGMTQDERDLLARWIEQGGSAQ